jgi:DNA-3-methyladenine glycosylase I
MSSLIGPGQPPEPVAGLLHYEDGTTGCWWAGQDLFYRSYHDVEWGRPVVDNIRLFEKMCLEGFQSGLSWLTILRKREGFRAAFAGFDPVLVAEFGPDDVDRLLADPGIVRHRGKIEATINNAKRTVELMDSGVSLATLLWSFEPPASERPAVCDHATLSTLGSSAASKRMSDDLRKRGFKFVGPTTMYALMQAMGMVNDHIEGCAVRAEREAERAALVRP